MPKIDVEIRRFCVDDNSNDKTDCMHVRRAITPAQPIIIIVIIVDIQIWLSWFLSEL